MAGARGEECKEEVEVSGHGEVTALGAVDVSECKVMLVVDVAEGSVGLRRCSCCKGR